MGDLNGDQLDDLLFNNADEATKPKKGKLSVALYNKDTNTYDISDFVETLVDKDCGGAASVVAKPMLTTPHTVSLIDFDGDCLADLFITIQDEDDPTR